PRSGSGSRRSVPAIPELLEPADPRRRDRTLKPSGGPAGGAVHSAALAPVLAPAPVTPSAPPLLLFDHVSKWYGPVIGVNQVTLELRPGITGLVGQNGSGKSTLMRLAAGHLRPDLGQVLLGGHEAWTASAKFHVGYCPELDTF